MLKANIGLSRKITRDYNSTGYSVNLEGEITAALDDHEGVLGRIKELFSLAEEALAQEIDRDQGEQAIGRRDEEPVVAPNPPHTNGPAREETRTNDRRETNGSGGGVEAITNKQAQFVFSLAKRQRLSNTQLDSLVEQTTGRRVRVYDLSKKEAGKVIDALNGGGRDNGK